LSLTLISSSIVTTPVDATIKFVLPSIIKPSLPLSKSPPVNFPETKTESASSITNGSLLSPSK